MKSTFSILFYLNKSKHPWIESITNQKRRDSIVPVEKVTHITKAAGTGQFINKGIRFYRFSLRRQRQYDQRRTNRVQIEYNIL